MVSQEIITALKNSIEHGDSLQNAIKILISSGYSAKEVKEASRFVGGGDLASQKTKPGEHLTMPRQKRIIPRLFRKKTQKQTLPKQLSAQQLAPQKITQESQEIKQAIGTSQPQLIQTQTPQSSTSPTPTTTPLPATTAPMPTQNPTLISTTPIPVTPIPSSQMSPLGTHPPSEPIAQELEKIKPQTKSKTKQILLLLILLILIGTLIITIVFRDKIMSWFT